MEIRKKIFKTTIAFGIFSILFNLCVRFFRSELWNSMKIWYDGIKNLTLEEIFALYPQYLIPSSTACVLLLWLMWVAIYKMWNRD